MYTKAIVHGTGGINAAPSILYRLNGRNDFSEFNSNQMIFMIAPLFRIKICGVRCPEDVAAVAECGADAVGFNFYPKSIRYVGPQAITKLSEIAAKNRLLRVGVFVNETLDRLLATAASAELDAIQLHGDETIEFANAIKAASGLRIIRAIRLPKGVLSATSIETAADHWLEAGFRVLLDADAGPRFGGSGEALDWKSIGQWVSSRSPSIEWTLSGGLNTSNIGAAIRLTGADSIDVASGVESTRGVKDHRLIQSFVAAAR